MKIYKVVGLMSGTSLDGLDLAYCHLWYTGKHWDFNIQASRSISYDVAMRNQLKNTIYLSALELLIFHNDYGTWLGKQAIAFIESNTLEVDFIASHGHTTHHQPQKGLTFQIGSGQHLANASGKKVICDFRTNDVALGGQGAPLVPIGDRLLFGAYDFCLNLGGISNISFEYNDRRIAYDVGLANMILNHITQKIDLPFDAAGALAQKGQINPALLQKLNALEFYTLPFPKSIGFEWFVEKVAPLVDATEDRIENLLHTAVHHITDQIAIQINKYIVKNNSTLLVTGGGALNTFLIATLREKLGTSTTVEIPSKTLIENKEALIFALMGVLRGEEKVNVLKSVTGAKSDSSSGVAYLPS